MKAASRNRGVNLIIIVEQKGKVKRSHFPVD
jgi:hypothetical protein